MKICFVVDTSASMGVILPSGQSILDAAKQFVEAFIQERRSGAQAASIGATSVSEDEYFIVTTCADAGGSPSAALEEEAVRKAIRWGDGDLPGHLQRLVVCGWGEEDKFVSRLRSLRTRGCGSLANGILAAFSLATRARVSSEIETLASGWAPWEGNGIAVVVLTDGGSEVVPSSCSLSSLESSARLDLQGALHSFGLSSDPPTTVLETALHLSSLDTGAVHRLLRLHPWTWSDRVYSVFLSGSKLGTKPTVLGSHASHVEPRRGGMFHALQSLVQATGGKLLSLDSGFREGAGTLAKWIRGVTLLDTGEGVPSVDLVARQVDTREGQSAAERVFRTYVGEEGWWSGGSSAPCYLVPSPLAVRAKWSDRMACRTRGLLPLCLSRGRLGSWRVPCLADPSCLHPTLDLGARIHGALHADGWRRVEVATDPAGVQTEAMEVEGGGRWQPGVPVVPREPRPTLVVDPSQPACGREEMELALGKLDFPADVYTLPSCEISRAVCHQLKATPSACWPVYALRWLPVAAQIRRSPPRRLSPLDAAASASGVPSGAFPGADAAPSTASMGRTRLIGPVGFVAGSRDAVLASLLARKGVNSSPDVAVLVLLPTDFPTLFHLLAALHRHCENHPDLKEQFDKWSQTASNTAERGTGLARHLRMAVDAIPTWRDRFAAFIRSSPAEHAVVLRSALRPYSLAKIASAPLERRARPEGEVEWLRTESGPVAWSVGGPWWPNVAGPVRIRLERMEQLAKTAISRAKSLDIARRAAAAACAAGASAIDMHIAAAEASRARSLFLRQTPEKSNDENDDDDDDVLSVATSSSSFAPTPEDFQDPIDSKRATEAGASAAASAGAKSAASAGLEAQSSVTAAADAIRHWGGLVAGSSLLRRRLRSRLRQARSQSNSLSNTIQTSTSKQSSSFVGELRPTLTALEKDHTHEKSPTVMSDFRSAVANANSKSLRDPLNEDDPDGKTASSVFFGNPYAKSAAKRRATLQTSSSSPLSTPLSDGEDLPPLPSSETDPDFASFSFLAAGSKRPAALDQPRHVLLALRAMRAGPDPSKDAPGPALVQTILQHIESATNDAAKRRALTRSFAARAAAQQSLPHHDINTLHNAALNYAE